MILGSIIDHPCHAERYSREATPYGIWLPIVLDLGAICALTTVGLTILLAQSRIYYAMAHDGLLPSIFARVHHRTLTPWVSTIVCGQHFDLDLTVILDVPLLFSRYHLRFHVGYLSN